jgi:NAD+ diphosphatase
VTPPNTFTGAELDRAGDRRTDDDWVAAQLADPAARAVVVGRDGVHVAGDRLALLPLEQAGAGPLLLGLGADGPVFAAEPAAGNGALMGLRDAAATLPRADGGLAAYAAALLNWHRRHRFCANCGAPTEIREAGHVRGCPDCGAQHHPRTDPVVIMLVLRGEEVLLGRQPTWPPGRYSALAGVVEPGESLEEAVAREVREEARVEIGTPRYVSSQPWPFPSSLMLGFAAPWASGEPRIGDEELEDVRWFSRKAVEDAVAERGELRLPPPLAIARRLLDGWLESRPERP